MADTLLLQLVSPERSLVEEQVTDVQIPALDGFIGVLPGHAPLISELKPGGVLSYRVSASGAEKFLAVFGGFVEVLPDRVRVLADGAQPKEEIDLNQARAELDRALAAMQNLHSEAIDPAVAVAEAMRAQAKVDTATKG
jgi:F-type H+-transporting ATPase subunit epsilon